MSSRLHPNFVSPTLFLFAFVFCGALLAEAPDTGVSNPSNSAKAVLGAARELIELMADRLTLAEAVAQRKWNDATVLDDENADAILNDALLRLTKESGVDANLAEPYVKGQIQAFKERQRQLFTVWKKAGVDGFDEMPDRNEVAASLEKNMREQMKKLQELKPVLCSSEMMKALRELATGIFARRALDKDLLAPLFEPLELKAQEEGGSCVLPKGPVTNK